MKLKETEKVRAFINKVLEDREIEIREIETLISTVNAKISECDNLMEQAVKESNTEMYREAIKEKKDHEILKEMHTRRLDQLTVKPLIDKAEYEKMVNKIKSEFEEIKDKAEERIFKTYFEINELGHELREAQEIGCEVLQKLQHDIYQDKDRTIHPTTGKMLFIPSQDQSVSIGETIYFAMLPAQNAIYTNLKDKYPELKSKFAEEESRRISIETSIENNINKAASKQ